MNIYLGLGIYTWVYIEINSTLKLLRKIKEAFIQNIFMNTL